MTKVVSSALLLACLTLNQHASAAILKLAPLTTFGTNGDGTIRPNDVDYLDDGTGEAGQLQRGMAWNPATGHLLVVCRTNAASPTRERVIIIDSTTGTNVGTLDMSSLVDGGGNGSFHINMIGVADDGTIYAANLSNQQTPAEMALYKWDNEGAGMAFPYVWS